MTTVRFDQDHGVGTIVLANPPSNRIGSQFAVDLRAAVHDASLSDSRVLLIRSDGPNFCMGAMSRSGQERAPTGSARSSPSATVRFMPWRHCAFPPWRWSGAEQSAAGLSLLLLATFWSRRRMRHFSPSRFVRATFRWQAGYSGSQNGLGAPVPLNSLYWVSRSAASSRAIWALLRSWCLKPIWMKRAVISWTSSRTAQPRLMRQRARFSKRGRREASPQRT